MTLLLGPPGAGKSTLMKTLAGQMDRDLKVAKTPFISTSHSWKLQWVCGYLDRVFTFLLSSCGLVLCAVRGQHHIQRP